MRPVQRPVAQELLYSATVVITNEMPVDRLWHAVPAFRMITEVWLRILETYRDGPHRHGIIAVVRGVPTNPVATRRTRTDANSRRTASR